MLFTLSTDFTADAQSWPNNGDIHTLAYSSMGNAGLGLLRRRDMQCRENPIGVLVLIINLAWIQPKLSVLGKIRPIIFTN